MSLYPSLEDMKVDQLAQAQIQVAYQFQEYHAMAPTAPNSPPYPLAPALPDQRSLDLSHLYPVLNEYMGLEFTEEVLAANMPEYLPVSHAAPSSVVPYGSSGGMVAPLSGSSGGLQRAQVSHGIRQVILCKNEDRKVGVRIRAINKGVFVCLVRKNSPAALAGLRFGDQILEINGRTVAGYSMEKVHEIFRKADENGITVAVRDRPFERTVTLHKDSVGHIGFQFKDGQVTAIVKDSSAARNGLLTDHHILEVNGQNVVGLKDKEITSIIEEGGQVITVTVMPSFIYKHMIKQMDFSVVTKLMDHSIPDL